MAEKKQKPIGAVTHFFGHISVAIVKFKRNVKAGETVCFKGATSDFCQKLDSIQFNHEEIKVAKKGQQVGIKVKEKVREGDEVYEAEK
ncbi:MAG: translation elongation factor-like protein [Candidatus Paceibacterota bacterium]|jgi:putative protease